MREEEKEKEIKKQDFENVKKTAEAHGTLSEVIAEKEAEKIEEITEGMIKEEKESTEEKTVEGFEKKGKEIEGDKRGKRDSKEVKEELVSAWEPKTKLGREVKDRKITNIDEILDNKRKILEEEIVDNLLDIKSDLITIGQAKGKFGGGKRRVWRQTQKKTKEGNIPTFSTFSVIGDENGHIGIGLGKSKETLPARDKAIRKAKLNLIKIKRGCAHFDCSCNEEHTVPYEVKGKSGSVRIKLIPAPQGTGLVAGDECKKILKVAGIKDVYTVTSGNVRTTFNLAKACINALSKTTELIKQGVEI